VLNTKSSVRAHIVHYEPCKYRIEGAVDFSTVPDLQQQLSLFLVAHQQDTGFAGKQPLVFDFSKTSSCNSAALALILEAVKQAKQAKLNLQFDNLPEALLLIAKAYGIDIEIRAFFK